jgi:hypothetical protein
MVIALSGRPEAQKAALDAGADFFVSKGESPERLLDVLRMVNSKKGGEDVPRAEKTSSDCLHGVGEAIDQSQVA